MHFGRVCPGEPEEADGEGGGAEHGGGKTRFRGCGAVVFGDDFGVAGLVDEGDVDKGDHDAEDDGEEGERGDALGPAAGLLEDDGVGGEEEEEGSVDDGEEEREQRYDGLVDEHDPGAECADAELLCDGLGCYAGYLVETPG